MSGPPWLAELRQSAAKHARECGLPGPKKEGWQFTPVAKLVSMPFASAAAQVDQWANWEHEWLPESNARVTVVNGRVGKIDRLPQGVSVSRLQELSDQAQARAYLGHCVEAVDFSALNASMFDDALVILAEAGYESRLEVAHVGVAEHDATVCYPRTLVIAEPGARLTLIESFATVPGKSHLFNTVTEVALKEDACVEHVRATFGTANTHHVGALGVSQSDRSAYVSRVVTLGGALSRLDIEVGLRGEGASCVLEGVYHADEAEHVDHRTRIDHEQPGCNSRENYRGVIDGSGHAVFDGTIVVHRDAQKTSAQQENRNLLLSDRATVNTKPHLEIDADDVTCSHGATVGALDEDQLFYLQSRGIGEARAHSMLTLAFVRSLVDSIIDAQAKERLLQALCARLPGGRDSFGERE